MNADMENQNELLEEAKKQADEAWKLFTETLERAVAKRDMIEREVADARLKWSQAYQHQRRIEEAMAASLKAEALAAARTE